MKAMPKRRPRSSRAMSPSTKVRQRACGGGKLLTLAPGQRQHAGRDIDAGDREAGLCQRQRDPAGSAAQFQHRTARRLRQAVIERDVADDRRCAAHIECVICSNEEGFRTS
jgi:hypothetical protein